MDVCEEDHEPLAYWSNDYKCPACDMRDILQADLDDAVKQIDNLTNERDDLDQQLAEANEKLERYKLLEEKIGGMIHERL